MATLLEINELIEGKSVEEPKQTKTRLVTKEDLIQFRLLLDISDDFKEGLRQTESWQEYYDAFELMDASVDAAVKEDVFYAAKLGFFFENVPCKLVYLLQKALKTYDTPNRAISAIDVRVLDKYLKPGVLPVGVSIKQIIENLLGNTYQTLTKYRKAVVYKDAVEVYVPDVDKVMVVPKEMEQYFSSAEDVDTVAYTPEAGVSVQGKLVRVLGDRVGLTYNDFDLRAGM